MADHAKPRRRSAGAGIGELQLLRGQRDAEMPVGDDERAGSPTRPSEAPVPGLPAPLAPPTPAPAPRDAALLRTEVYLPEELIAGVRTYLRPARTGHPRTLSVPLLLQAYIRAVDGLGLKIDVRGLALGSEDEAVARVVAALEAWRRS